MVMVDGLEVECPLLVLMNNQALLSVPSHLLSLICLFIQHISQKLGLLRARKFLEIVFNRPYCVHVTVNVLSSKYTLNLPLSPLTPEASRGKGSNGPPFDYFGLKS